MIESFDAIWQRVCERKGGPDAVEAKLGRPKTRAQVEQLSDDRVLAEFTRKVFQSGFVWRVVDDKWPSFEEVFFNFDPQKMLLMPDEMLEQKATDARIIRNLNKVRSIRDNAQMLAEIRAEHGSFGRFAATFDVHTLTQLWDYLKQHGARLGGNTGPYALRVLGIDTFLLSQDVEGYFRQHNVISGSVRSKRSLAAITEAFAAWQEQSGRSLQELSLIVALSCGDNHR